MFYFFKIAQMYKFVGCLIKCRLPLNRTPIFFKILLSTNLICLCQFRFLSIITPRNFNSVTLFRIMLLNFKSGNFRGILFKFVCL